MSEQSQGAKIPLIHIAIVSSNESFHTTLLATFIGEHINAKCSIIKRDTKKLPEDIQLVLLDCLQESIDSLNNILRELSAHSDNVVTALLNAEHSDEHENLLDWPCVSGIFYVDTPQDQLLRGIEQLLGGDYWVPRRLLHNFFNKHRQIVAGKNHASHSLSNIQLTNREREILKMIKDGMSNSAVSASLSLSEHTVKSHLYNIYKKIGVRNRMEASNWARDHQNINNL
ncbi:LuxR C-terminal-related transcriptional regulator [Agarilytica rhodophyticola]|uniref:LuxR C-terminal-related transcriptional regulator n=1 Tax=Agarilytica rhodophyticola TaxID=1737490 RepID=UPI000B349654|nr:LuxR C-terminal-related transcriptional regulator [Agarilytica rhodophyticola]